MTKASVAWSPWPVQIRHKVYKSVLVAGIQTATYPYAIYLLYPSSLDLADVQHQGVLALRHLPFKIVVIVVEEAAGCVQLPVVRHHLKGGDETACKASVKRARLAARNCCHPSWRAIVV